MSARRTTIQRTASAKESLARLPQKVRRGLLEKVDNLLAADDPQAANKALVGPLSGFYRIVYSRYRAIYSIEKERLAGGAVLIHVIIRFVAAGIRKEGDKHDIYRFALKVIQMGVIKAKDKTDAAAEEASET